MCKWKQKTFFDILVLMGNATNRGQVWWMMNLSYSFGGWANVISISHKFGPYIVSEISSTRFVQAESVVYSPLALLLPRILQWSSHRDGLDLWPSSRARCLSLRTLVKKDLEVMGNLSFFPALTFVFTLWKGCQSSIVLPINKCTHILYAEPFSNPHGYAVNDKGVILRLNSQATTANGSNYVLFFYNRVIILAVVFLPSFWLA